MFRPIFFAVATAALVAGCTTGGPMAATATGSRVTVTGAGDDLLKLRSGPGLEYKVLLGLPDGTALRRRDCVTELGSSGAGSRWPMRRRSPGSSRPTT